jgi:hypothetical protein
MCGERILTITRKIGADEKHSAADKLMGRLAKMKPEPRKPAGKPSTHTPINLKR